MVTSIKVSKINSGMISQTRIYNVMTAKMRAISNQDRQNVGSQIIVNQDINDTSALSM